MLLAVAAKIAFVIVRNGADFVPGFVESFPEIESTYSVGISKMTDSDDFRSEFATILEGWSLRIPKSNLEEV